MTLLFIYAVTKINKIKNYIYIESLMSCHLLLNLLHESANMILCEAAEHNIIFANECNKFSNK